MSAPDESAREKQLDHLIVEVAQPLIARMLVRCVRSQRLLEQQDADDVASVVMLRLMTKLRSMTDREQSIDDFDSYVVTLTYNAVYDVLRERFPQRTRLKNRLRYVLTHDSRLALWSTEGELACGLPNWRDQSVSNVPHFHERDAPAAALNQREPAAALVTIFESIGHPLRLDDLAEAMSRLWGVLDRPYLSAATAADHRPSALTEIERRQFLGGLWTEIRSLRPLQRKALLLNLRDETNVNVLALLVLTGTASFDDVADAVEMSPEELAGTWNDLPLGDARIGELMNLTRQQVINLRKSARARLSRRLATEKRKAD